VEASGETLTTSNPAFWPIGQLTLRLDPANDLLHIGDDTFNICGSTTPRPREGSTDLLLC